MDMMNDDDEDKKQELTPAEQRVLRAMDIEEVCNCKVSVPEICKKCDL